MKFAHQIQHYFETLPIPVLLLVGVLIIIGFYGGNLTKKIKLPSIIGFMIIGMFMGPSFLDVLNEGLQEDLGFITEMALGFVAFSIGLELSMASLRSQGSGIISIIFAESFTAFIVTSLAVYLLTRDLALALVFGSLAPASAPAGTVAVIKEYKAKGSLTKALYAVVGFDDGLAIIIFGFSAAVVKMLLAGGGGGVLETMLEPLKEIFLSLFIGGGVAVIFCLLSKAVKNNHDMMILVFGFVLLTIGFCSCFHLSLILTNMIIGLIIVNTQPRELVHRIGEQLSTVMPLFFVLFFALAGANLHIAKIPALGILGMVYILARSAGLIGGARLGGMFGRVDDKVRKWVGLGILSQAGVAIGLSLIIKHDLRGMGPVVERVGDKVIHLGDKIGSTAITTITATCIFFEVVGPILTKVALKKAGEINE